MPAQHPYHDFLHQLAKPARYVGGEFQSVRKDWDAVELHYALAFPDLYDIGMSHLGTKILYRIVNDLPWAVGERIFAPWPDLEAELRQRDLPLVSLESWRPLHMYDVVGFSLQYELTWTNLLNMLDLGGIALRAADRPEEATFVIAGGPNATHPEPMAPFIDAFVIGDGEVALPQVLEVVREGRAEGASRAEILARMAALGGVYCPALYAAEVVDDGGFLTVSRALEPRAPLPVVRTIIPDINAFPFPDDAPVAAAEAIFDRMSIEIARGCTEGCRFCQAGMIYRPVRERSPESVVQTVLGAVDKAGYDEVSLTTLSTADYSAISPLIKQVAGELKPRNTALSVASLRAYGLAEDLFDDISSIRASSLTFAPEAGTQRMRDVVNKNITDADLDVTAHRVFSRQWRKMKCYFMIGLPTETDEDVEGIVNTAARMRDIGRQYKSEAAVTVSVSSHVPKPHTPFQWAAMDTLEEIGRKQRLLHIGCRETGLKSRKHDPRTSFLECVLGRGDRRIADAVEHAFHAGARFDGWDEKMRFELWLAAFDACEVDTERYTTRLRQDIALPWQHIDVGLAEGFLAREYKRSVGSRLSPPCGKPVGMQVHHTNVADADADGRKLVCYNCGVACDMSAMRAERVDFLQQLGAAEPWQPPVSEEATPAPLRGKPTRKPYRGPVFRYRLRFTRQGAEALTSHLDLVRAMPRLLRRAKLPLRYSDGFHPKPVLAFAPALPLGTPSRGELMDLDLTSWIEPADVLSRLQRASTVGMRFLEVVHVPLDEMRLGAALVRARYAIALRTGPRNAPSKGIELGVLARALWHFMAAGSWIATVERQETERLLDLRRDVLDLRIGDDGRLLLEVDLTAQTARARPREVIDAAMAGLGCNPVEAADVERLGLVTVADLADDEAGANQSIRISNPSRAANTNTSLP